MPRSKVVLLTGEIGIGKTTVCRRVADAVREQDWRIAGIITHPTYDPQGRKAALFAMDLWGREARLLASLERRLSDLYCGPHSFDPATFAWAIQATQAALAQGPHLAILDEVGPLELATQAGFAPLLGPLLNARCPTLLVVRRAWRPALEAYLEVRPRVFEVDGASRNDLPTVIVEALLQPSPKEG